MATRFWINTDGGPVRLSLEPGRVITLHGGSTNDEGYSYWETYYSVKADHLVGEHYYRGADRGGCCSGYSTAVVRIDRLDALPRRLGRLSSSRLGRLEERSRPVSLPDWHLIDRMDRDHTAEDAGY